MFPNKQKQGHNNNSKANFAAVDDEAAKYNTKLMDEHLGLTVDLDTSQRHLVDSMGTSPQQNQFGKSKNGSKNKQKGSNNRVGVDLIDGSEFKQVPLAGEQYKSQHSVASSAVQGSYDRSSSLVKLRSDQFLMGNINVRQGQKSNQKYENGDSNNNQNDGNIERRQILFGENAPNLTGKNLSNKVRTQRYSWLTWAPLSLLFQFKRAANIYFLVISILTMMSFSPKNPASMIGTFAIVLLFTMLKEAYEDYGRYKQDKEVNGKLTLVLNHMTRQFESVKWQNVKVGSIVKFSKDLEAPADILILFSSNANGFVYVDTMNLDGETNLKEKTCLVEHFVEQNVSEIAGYLNCDQPNEALDSWEGQMAFNKMPNQLILSNIKNLLLRGCYVRNTEYGIGVVVYTGMQSKIMKNAKKMPHKTSNVMRLMNNMLYSVFLFQIILILICASLSLVWAKQNADTISYLNMANAGSKDKKVQTGRWFVQLLTYWVAYSHMIPISLYVAIELLKLGQAYFVNGDVRMYDEEAGAFARCRNSDLIEELGQVEMLFSDKTGTLTMNKMIFKKCQIDGIKYGEHSLIETANPNGILQSGANQVQAIIKKENQRANKLKVEDLVNHDGKEEEVTPNGKLNINVKGQSTKNMMHTNFVRMLAICHTVVCDKNKHSGHITYQASSPDELALVMGAKQLGVELLAREHGKIFIINNVTKQKMIYKIEAEFPFDSTRKRMSLIVKDESGNYILMCKGADTVMYDRIVYEKSRQKDMRKMLEKDLYDYSCEGLRTLVLTQRNVSSEEFAKFSAIYGQLMASNNVLKETKLMELFNAMEQNLRYLGSTAIEDLLQEGVPETIEKLIETDIRFFMLTGDKLETAIEIAKSCRVIQGGMNVIQVVNKDRFELHNHFLDILQQPPAKKGQHQHNYRLPVTTLKNVIQLRQVIAIDGATLAIVMADEELTNLFFHASLISKSIVCCRVSPKQKADIVQIFKSRGKWITLAIGDGANDVSMIMEAHIGVGIRGKEGTQAVRSADYAICQFRFLLRLLLVTGRLGYIRVTSLTCYYFYKNIILVFTEIYFSFYNGFSGQIFFLDWLPMIYNTFFTSWQCWFCYLLEQDVTEAQTLRHPTIYKAGQVGAYFSYTIFWKWILLAIWHGLVGFYASLLPESQTSSYSSGVMATHWLKSTIAFTIIIHLVCYKLFVESIFWNTISIAAGIVSILIYYIVLAVGQTQTISFYLQPELQGVLSMMFSQPKFWLIIVAVPIIQLIPDITIKIIQAVFYPTPAQKIIMQQKLEEGIMIPQIIEVDSMVYDESQEEGSQIDGQSNYNTVHQTQNARQQHTEYQINKNNQKSKKNKKQQEQPSNNSSLRESQEFKAGDNQQAMFEMVLSPIKPAKAAKGTRRVSRQLPHSSDEEISFDHNEKINKQKHSARSKANNDENKNNIVQDQENIYSARSKNKANSKNKKNNHNRMSLSSSQSETPQPRTVNDNQNYDQNEDASENENGNGQHYDHKKNKKSKHHNYGKNKDKVQSQTIKNDQANFIEDVARLAVRNQESYTNASTTYQYNQAHQTKSNIGTTDIPKIQLQNILSHEEEEKQDGGGGDKFLIPRGKGGNNKNMMKSESGDLRNNHQATPKQKNSPQLNNSSSHDQNVSRSLNQLYKQGTRQLEGHPDIRVHDEVESNIFGARQSIEGESVFNRQYQDTKLLVEQLTTINNNPVNIVDGIARSPNSISPLDLLYSKSYDVASLGHPLEQNNSLPTQNDEQQISKPSYSSKKKQYVEKYHNYQTKDQ